MNRDGCGETKGCLFKPAGCIPNLDCTMGIIFYVSGANKLTVQLVATSLLPAPQLQYIAIGFSHDPTMGDDFVTECVLSPSATEFSVAEVFASYNRGKTNDRTYLNSTENALLYEQVEGEVVDGRLTCQFVQTIVPQMSSKHGRLWNLNHKYYILGATGSSQPDEVNVHDTSVGSHFYPIVSARPINPSLIGSQLFDLPPPFPEPEDDSSQNRSIVKPEPDSTSTDAQPTEAPQTETTQPLNAAVRMDLSLGLAFAALCVALSL
ncbi:Protein Y57G11A.4 [Aphelenchoides avenae]|nr:Protein Y57G11A.4 [Aphelenchus avenae]